MNDGPKNVLELLYFEWRDGNDPLAKGVHAYRLYAAVNDLDMTTAAELEIAYQAWTAFGRPQRTKEKRR